MYVGVVLRGINCDIKYRVLEDEPSTNTFESEWEFTDPPSFADTLTEAEDALINLAIAEAAWPYDEEPDDRG